jgi:hypothetical protein
MAADKVTVHVVGDVFPDVEDGLAAFRPLAPLFGAADLVAGNCEGVYSDRPAPAPSRKHFCGAPSERGAFLGDVPFHVLTLANNHMVDGGYVGIEDTVNLLRSQGILTTGADKDIASALTPAIAEANGLRVAFVAVCSVFPVGYEARPDRPGIAPLRVRTHYSDPDPNFWEPGIPPAVTTIPDPNDLQRFHDALAKAKQDADFVVAMCHWGYSSWLEELQDYELELARGAAEHGADAVVCHHQHSLRGIEFHGGVPIFYGIGTLVHHFGSLGISAEDRAKRQAVSGGKASMADGEVFPLFPFGADARKTGVAVLDFSPSGPPRAGFVPAMIRADGSTEPLRPGDPEGQEILDYVQRLSTQSGFSTTLSAGERDGFLFAELQPGS